jgi:predicted transcriptional regulator
MIEYAPIVDSKRPIDPPARFQKAAGFSDPDHPTVSVQEIMTNDVPRIDIDEDLQAAADKMKSFETGFLPVCRDGRPVGIITDRDIARCITASGGATRKAGELMSPYPHVCMPNEGLYRMVEILRDLKLRCIMVVDHDGRLAGVVTHEAIRRWYGDSEFLFADESRPVPQTAEPFPHHPE